MGGIRVLGEKNRPYSPRRFCASTRNFSSTASIACTLVLVDEDTEYGAGGRR